MKVLMIAPTPFFSDRGCHVRILTEIRALQSKGINVVLCTYHLGEDIPDLQIHRNLKVPWYKKRSAGPSYHKLYIDLLLLWKTYRVFLTFKPDIIHAHLHEGILIGKLLRTLFGVPLVADLQGSLTDEMSAHGYLKRNGLYHIFLKKVEIWISNMPDGLIFSASNSMKFYESIRLIKKNRYATIGDIVETEFFCPGNGSQQLRHSLGIPDKSQVVVYLGVLSEYQGIDILLEVAKRVIEVQPETYFLIMGYPNEEYYKNEARRLEVSDNVILTGRIDYFQASKYLILGDVAVSPKISLTESNGKLFNYMAVGLPVVVFDTPLHREILGEGGKFVPLTDVNGFAKAILDVCSDKKWAKWSGKYLYDRVVRNFSLSSMAEGLIIFYDKVQEFKQPVPLKESSATTDKKGKSSLIS